ncbi:MAG: MATE family efflux transporter [Alphaproteobacteria bacterium]|nr:MATE family efflux transporter [Alphaproteobacteria bacterium]
MTADFAELDLVHAGRRVVGQGVDAWAAEARETLKLALPLIFTQVAQMAIMTTDVIMLGRVGEKALASSALGITVFFFCWLFGAGPVAAVAPMIAHILGASPDDRANVRAVVRMGFWAVVMVSLPLILLMLLTEPLMVFLGQRPDLAAGAGRFTAAICLGLPFSLSYQVLRNYSTALGRPHAPMAVMVLGIAFNFAGDYALIFGHFGAPRLELMGAGIASACSYAFQFLALLAIVLLTPKLRAYRIFENFFHPNWEKLAEVFRLGMPIGLTMMFEAMLFNTATILMGTFGAATVAAHQISMNVPSNTFMVPLGIAMAATIRVGLASGAGDREAVRRAGYTALGIGALFMATTSVLLAAFPRQIAELYFSSGQPDSAEAVRLATTFLKVAAAFQIFDGLQVVAALSLRGLKDARAPMWIAGASYWLAGFPVCILLGFGLHMKGFGIWIGLAFALLVAAASMCARFWWLSRER